MNVPEQTRSPEQNKAETPAKQTSEEELENTDPEFAKDGLNDASSHEPSLQAEVEGKEHEKKSCCTRRKVCTTIIGVTLVIAIGVPIVIIQMTPTIAKNRAIDSLDMSEASQRIFKALGTYLAILAAGVGPTIANSKPFTQDDIRTEDIDLGWVASTKNTKYGWSPSDTLEIEESVVGEYFSYEIITEDDIFGTDNVAELATFLTNEKYVPFEDTIKFLFDDENVLDDFLTDLKLLPKGLEAGYILPTPTHEWEEQSSDESISRIFWYGYGCVLIMGPEFSEIYDGGYLAGFRVDLTDISGLEVREGFRPYGCRIQFDVYQNVISIYDAGQDKLFKPGDDQQEWEEAKFLVRVTVLAIVTVREHLLWSHLMSSNVMTKAMTVHLPPNHPIRRLLTIFTFHTNDVNSDAMAVLTPERGWVHRMSALTYDSLIDLFGAGYKVCDIFEPFKDKKVSPGLQKVIDVGRFPYYTEGMAYYQLVDNFVAEWAYRSREAASDVYALAFYEELVVSSKGMAYEVPPYTPDNFIDIVSQLIWVATAYHEVVGTTVEYTQLPNYSGARAIPGNVRVDTESYLMALYLTGRAGVRMPKLIGDFENFIGQGDGIPEWEFEVWANFQGALKMQSDVVQLAYAMRLVNDQPEFKLMDPARFESSVAL